MYPGPGPIAAALRGMPPSGPLPSPPPVPPAPSPPSPMDHHEKSRLRTAAFHASRVYPGPVGELISRELLSWEDFGYRLGSKRMIMNLVDQVLRPATEGGP